MPRLFTGLEIPAEVSRKLSGLRGGLPNARWVEPENYHVTLRFIGDIDEGMARDLYAALGESRRRDPVEVALDRLDTFGGGKPRALFARVAATPQLDDLQAEQERLVRRAGLPPESRRFTPHVTLARLRNGSPAEIARYIVERGPFPKLAFTADRFVLYSARPSTGGGPYVIEAAYPFW
jgi:RNA 2',3'-cyclic 3'-phosphodiesterase